MEAATAGQRVNEAEAETRPTEAAAENASGAQMFRYSTWVHVGPGSETCEAVNEAEGTCSCSDPLHFHAWLRLPNKFQYRDIRKKSLAAKAIVEIGYRDPEADQCKVMDNDLAALRVNGDVSTLIDDLLAPEFAQDYLAAMSEMQEDDRWEHIDAHREQYARIGDAELEKSEEERSDEFKTLERHIAAFREELNKRMESIQRPKREAYEQMDRDKLVDLTREKKIEAEADAEYWHVHNEWAIYVGTYVEKGSPVIATARKFESIEQMESAAPEVVNALETAFVELQVALGRAVQGN